MQKAKFFCIFAK